MWLAPPQDMDLVPLLLQENYVNHRPSTVGNELQQMQVVQGSPAEEHVQEADAAQSADSPSTTTAYQPTRLFNPAQTMAQLLPFPLQMVAKAADALSVGDHVTRRVRQHQHWSLMPFAAVSTFG